MAKTKPDAAPAKAPDPDAETLGKAERDLIEGAKRYYATPKESEADVKRQREFQRKMDDMQRASDTTRHEGDKS